MIPPDAGSAEHDTEGAGSIVVSLHRFEHGREVVFEDRFWAHALIEDEEQSSLATADGGYAWLVGHPSSTSRPKARGLEYVSAYYGLEIASLTPRLASMIWEVASAGRLAVARWADPEQLTASTFDETDRVSRLRLDPPPTAVAIAGDVDVAELPVGWGVPQVTLTPDDLLRFLGADEDK